MKVLVIEDDSLVSDLLETVISGLFVGVQVLVADTLESGEQLVQDHEFDLIVIDWNLPGGSGLDFVKQYRGDNTDTPVVMVSGRNDKQSVILAAKAGINQYISKPFTVEMLHERLKELLKDTEHKSFERAVEDYLSEHIQEVVQLPTNLNPQSILELMERTEDISPAELADTWRGEVSLMARLLDVANSSSFKRSGQPVKDLKDAVSSLGVEMALKQALALSMDAGNSLQHESLQSLAKFYLERSMEVAKTAQQASLLLGLQPEMFEKAGLLSRIGELAVLKVLNQFLAAGGELPDQKIEELVDEWAQEYGNKLKIQWNLPLELRDMIGAVHFLVDGTVKRDRLIMRYSALKAAGMGEDEECEALQRRIGLDEDEPGGKNDAVEAVSESTGQ